VIYIFHGDNTSQSYSAYSDALKHYQNHEKFHQNAKSFDLDSFDRYLNTPSLFSQDKVIIIDNFFSLLKIPFDKAKKLIDSHPDFDYLFWQDKKIEAAKIKGFPKAEIKFFALPELLFTCLNAIKPQNQNDFLKKYSLLLNTLPIELIMFWFKNTLRRQLTTFSKFSPENIKKAYLSLIELDFATKNGTLTIPKNIALEKIILTLIDSHP